ncbi:Oxysterol-binding protein [Parathielavia appendiculata]|uniref:Oxysterol-binding protein n=1 Tax=Parathielavia appendiculata TaxID=2587402 RepID=A0AAN6TXW3_9PEZI|nr:Oxysterol-binding protein [Parathielavia appendiculata]
MSAISKLRDFFKFLGSVKGDLSNITAPPYFLAPHSVTEIGTCWVERPSLFAAPALEPDAELRALLVLKWILASLKRQLYIDGGLGQGIKKPLNAFLGEIFRAEWSDGKATANLVAEQVSHHPPITAVYMWDDEHGIRGEGYARVEMTFSGSVDIRQTGHAMLHIDRYDEDHLIFLPSCKVSGFMSGALFPELSGTYHIVSSSGFVSEIVFSGTSLLGTGQRNAVKATLYRRNDPSKAPLYVIAGCWSDRLTIFKGSTTKGEVVEVWDPARPENGASEARVEPLESQDCWESRKAWQGVIAALRRGDFGDTVTEKSKVEKAQRLMRAAEKEEGTTWQPLLFAPLSGPYEVFERLGSAVGWRLQADKTKGVWKVDRGEVKTLRRPFRPGLTPLGRETTETAKG